VLRLMGSGIPESAAGKHLRGTAPGLGTRAAAAEGVARKTIGTAARSGIHAPDRLLAILIAAAGLRFAFFVRAAASLQDCREQDAAS